MHDQVDVTRVASETETRGVDMIMHFPIPRTGAVLTTVPEAFDHPVPGYVGLHVMYRRV